MVLWLIRVVFILVLFGIGFSAVTNEKLPLGEDTWQLLAISISIGVFVIVGDYLAPRRKLQIFAGAFFGLLVGIVLAYALSFVTGAIVDQFVAPSSDVVRRSNQVVALTNFVNLMIGTITCYLSVSFVLQTKDDFRFIIPYFDFSRESKGNRPIVLDSSALIDGRVAEVAATGVFDTRLVLPRFVLDELQRTAESDDRLKRNRGRRGLDVVARLQRLEHLDLAVHEAGYLEDEHHRGVDALVMRLAAELDARVVTADPNLKKVAGVSGVDVINLNDLAAAVRGEALPGETLSVRIVRPGEEAHQGVGFLDDGTMVVVEHARPFVGQVVDFVVTNTRQTSAGRMIFGRHVDSEAADANGDDDRRGDADRPDAPADGAARPAKPEPRANDERPARPEAAVKRGGNGGLGRSPRRGDVHR